MNFAFSIQDVLGVLPEIIIALGACAMLILDLFLERDKKEWVAYLGIFVVILAAIASWCLINTAEPYVMGRMMVIDNYSLFFKFTFYLATILTLLLSINYAKSADLDYRGEFYTLMIFSLCGMLVMASGSNLITIYLGIELMALPIYVLVGFLKNDTRSNEGAMKYVILGGFASGLLLYGMSLIYGLTGTTDLAGINAALSAGTVSPVILTLSIVLMAAGFCFKLAGFPFHMWAPDAYQAAPTPVTAFMAVASKGAAFAAIVRVFLEALYPAYAEWQMILAVIAVLSMFYGNTVAIMQTNIKRMLAYSSIGHAGYALLGLVAGTGEGSAAIMFYILVYTLMNLGAFAVIIMMRKTGKVAGDSIYDYKGLAKNNKVVALVMLIFLFSLAGIPPMAGFMGKLYIFMALINQGYIILAVLGILTTAIAAFFYIRIVLFMYMKEPEGEFDLVKSCALYIVIAISVIGVILLGVVPGSLMELASKAALLL